jgi:hypothetical protein
MAWGAQGSWEFLQVCTGKPREIQGSSGKPREVNKTKESRVVQGSTMEA